MKIRDRIVELRRVPASQLAPNPANWRTHSAEQADALRGLLAEVGFAGAALAREQADGTLQLIDGHLRAETAGDEPIPVLILDVTAEEAAKLLATFDPIGAMAGADADKLAALLAEIETQSPAVQAMLDELKAENAADEVIEPGAGGDEFDATPEASGPTRTAVGDLWLIGGKHRLLVGDCTDPANVVILMNGEKADLVLTDPPYGIGVDGQAFSTSSHGGRKAYEFMGWDQDRPNAAIIKTILSYAPNQIVWGGNYFVEGLPPSMGWLVWDKGQDICSSDCELAFTSFNRALRRIVLNRVELQKDGTSHPTQKPIKLISWCIEKAGDDIRAILDPFLGSGTTLIAAHRLGRVCYGCEIEPRYADVILKRAEAEGLTVEKLP